MFWIISTVIFWIVCSIISYGAYFAYFQREFPSIAKEEYKSTRDIAIQFSLLGPIATIVLFQAKCFKHGLKFK